MDETLKILQDCYRHELTLVVRYLNFAVHVKGLDRLHLEEFFRRNAEDSIGHARKVGAKIAGLGGAAAGTVQEDLAGVPGDAEKMLRQALKDEQAAVGMYNKAVLLAKKDLGLREMLVHILKDEQASVDELTILLK